MGMITKKTIVLAQLERKALTVQEVAEMLAVAPLTIRRAIKSGKIKAMQIATNGRYRITIEELNEFIRKNSK
jgi:excisionase family DNA binding protein